MSNLLKKNYPILSYVINGTIFIIFYELVTSLMFKSYTVSEVIHLRNETVIWGNYMPIVK